MRIEELAFVCQEAARDLVSRQPRPLPPTVVLPGPQATRLVTLPDFPADDAGRAAVLGAFARDQMPATPAWGFIAEADLHSGQDVVVVVYGAHGHPPRITAAPFQVDGSLGEFAPPEALAPEALPFIRPLQHAVDHPVPARRPPPSS